jgi:hypothetical protein
MQVTLEKREDGSVAIEFDREAAQAMLASIVFASRFHEGILPLAGMIEAGLEADDDGFASPEVLCH